MPSGSSWKSRLVLPTKRRTAGWYMHQGFVDFDQGFAKTFWSKGCYFKCGTSLFRNKLLHSTGAFGRESKVICYPSKVYDIFLYPVPNPQIQFLFAKCSWPCFFATPASSLGCVHLTSNANFTDASITAMVFLTFDSLITVGEYCEIRSENDVLCCSFCFHLSHVYFSFQNLQCKIGKIKSWHSQSCFVIDFPHSTK